jgi:hypothetical protein
MNENLNHILSNKKCAYWTHEVFTKLASDFKTNYDKKHVIYNQYLYILAHGKNYIEKVRNLIHNLLYIWSNNNSVISDKECAIIWKKYVTNFTITEREIIVKYIKNSLELHIKTETPKKHINERDLELQEAHDKIDDLTSKLSALMEIYESDKKTHSEVSIKYNKLESEYNELCNNYSQVYKTCEFRGIRIDDLNELNNRLKSTIDELRLSRDFYRELYTNHGKY